MPRSIGEAPRNAKKLHGFAKSLPEKLSTCTENQICGYQFVFGAANEMHRNRQEKCTIIAKFGASSGEIKC